MVGHLNPDKPKRYLRSKRANRSELLTIPVFMFTIMQQLKMNRMR